MLDQPARFGWITSQDELDKLRNANGNRAASNAERFAALQAAFRFKAGLLSVKTKGDFLKISNAELGRQFGHRLAHLLSGSKSGFFERIRCNLVDASVQVAGLKVVISLVALNDGKEINLVPIELWAIHTGEMHFTADGHPAAAAHAGAIHHDRIQRYAGWNLISPGHFSHSLHHRQRTDGQHIIRPGALVQ